MCVSTLSVHVQAVYVEYVVIFLYQQVDCGFFNRDPQSKLHFVYHVQSLLAFVCSCTVTVLCLTAGRHVCGVMQMEDNGVVITAEPL